MKRLYVMSASVFIMRSPSDFMLTLPSFSHVCHMLRPLSIQPSMKEFFADVRTISASFHSSSIFCQFVPT